MSTPLKSARSIQQKLLTAKESLRSILTYCTYRKDDTVCSDRELEQKIKQIDREVGRLLVHVEKLESKARKEMRDEKSKEI